MPLRRICWTFHNLSSRAGVAAGPYAEFTAAVSARTGWLSNEIRESLINAIDWSRGVQLTLTCRIHTTRDEITCVFSR